MLLIAIMIGVSTLYLYCYFGKLATDSFMMMTDCLFESNWQNLSVHLQKYFILMIANAKRPFFYHGSKIATLNLETFTVVCVIFWIKFQRIVGHRPFIVISAYKNRPLLLLDVQNYYN